ncbi:hypothetical protein D9756_003513 [Leucocoprinus leucothites]|uniref:HD/PDEase domain-containing protein n=1 Tax=Leucocoprinus leucothites TaxID=201217 RepID=A0A8H5G6E2_9AGAR|nr:hypothetical protein D9756_003513 [Leucoagaricus leucothites]
MSGYPSQQEKSAITAAEKLMVETMARYDPSHDKYHVERVRKTALAIARSLPTTPDLLVVELAALLHDVLDKKYVSEQEAANPYAYFLPFFSSIDVSNPGLDLIPSGRAKLISEVVQNVSWTTEKRLREQGLWSSWHEACLELHCVQDADRLDAIGAFGTSIFLSLLQILPFRSTGIFLCFGLLELLVQLLTLRSHTIHLSNSPSNYERDRP